jgi:kinesin family protein C1
MEQMLGDKDHPGIIPRSMQKIFDSIPPLEKDGWEFKMQVRQGV